MSQTELQSSPFSRVERPLNLRETALEQLRTAIITGDLAEGELVSAPSLGQVFGISATPVREALMELVQEGLVETVKNKGFRVRAMTDKELDDLAQIRLLLEPPAMQWVAGKITPETFQQLNRLADSCLHAAERENLEEFLRIDREFHAQVLTIAGNPQLVDLATTLRRRTRLYGIAMLARKGELADSAREHHELIRMLRDADAVGAESLMRTHIGHTRKDWAVGENR